MRMRTDFPGGNCRGFDLAADRLRFEADTCGGPCSMWFHFVVEKPACDVLHCELVHGETALQWPYRDCVRPVFRRADMSQWERVPPTVVDGPAGTMQFDVACAGLTTEIAFCHPYQLADWQCFHVEHLAPAGARAVQVGRSTGGNPLFVCEAGRGEVEVLVTARCHAGETPGAYVLEGIMLGLLERADAVTVRAIPFMDVDGVVSGMYGKNRPPFDFYMGWGPAETWPEVAAYRDYLASLSRAPAIAVDCHAPTATMHHFIECGAWSGADALFQERLRGLVDAIVRRAAARPDTALDPAMTAPHPGWFGGRFEASLPGYLQSHYGTLSMTLEASYHRTHLGAVPGPDAWRALGRFVAESIGRE